MFKSVIFHNFEWCKIATRYHMCRRIMTWYLKRCFNNFEVWRIINVWHHLKLLKLLTKIKHFVKVIYGLVLQPDARNNKLFCCCFYANCKIQANGVWEAGVICLTEHIYQWNGIIWPIRDKAILIDICWCT